MLKKQNIDFDFCGATCQLQICNNPKGGLTEIDDRRTPKVIIKIHNKVSEIVFLQTLGHELVEYALMLNQTLFECSDQNNEKNFFQFDHGKLTSMFDEIFLAYENLKKVIFK